MWFRRRSPRIREVKKLADGSIKFDTELDSSGLEKGLCGLGEKSGTALGEVGQKINDGMAQSLAEIASRARDESNSIATDAISAQKLYESERDRLQNNRKNSDALYLAQLKENAEKIKQLRDEELRALKNAYAAGLIDTNEYFSRLEDFRDRYFETGSVGWQSYTAEILKYNKKLSDEQEKALSDAAKTTAENIEKRFDELIKQKEKFEEKLADYGGIARKNTIIGEDLKAEYTSPADMKRQNELLEEYCEWMSEAKRRVDAFWKTDTADEAQNERNAALRSAYFSQVRDMSVEQGIDFASSLFNMEESDFASHLLGFERKNELAEKIAAMLYSSEITEAGKSAGRSLGKDFTEELSGELEGLEGKFFSTGEEACRSFSDGFMSQLENVLKELSAQIEVNVLRALGGDGAPQNIENNTSYNIYGQTGADTIRLLREQDERRRLMLE